MIKYGQIKGCVRINAKGKKLSRFINTLHSHHICCFGQHCRNDVFYGEIYRSDLKKVKSAAEECGVELTYCEYRTLSEKLRRYRRRIGIFLGTAAAVCVIIFFSGMVMTIEISGNQRISDQEMIAALGELGIHQGTRMNSIDFRCCENRLRIMLEDLSWVGIRRTGNRLVVELTETVEKPEMLNERMPCDVYARKSAQITYTSVLDGQLMRIVGDYVREGDMLISGVAEDDRGNVTLHHAMGTITGIYEENVTFTAERSAENYLPTGKSDTEHTLHLFSLEIPLHIGRNGYKNRRTENTSEQMSIMGRRLPVWLERTHYTETSLQTAEYTDEELEVQLMDKIYLYEHNFIDEDTEILERKIIPHNKENSLEYEVIYTLRGDIGIQRELLVR